MWECLVYSTLRNDELLRDEYEHFEGLVTGELSIGITVESHYKEHTLIRISAL